MSTPGWKAAIVGCGVIAGSEDSPRREGTVESHAMAYYRHPEFTITAAVDTDPARLATFQGRWDIPGAYQSLTDMLESESIDIVSLCSPSRYHAPQLIEILESSSPVKVIFTEKPLCVDRHELASIIKASENNEPEILVNHTRRFDPAHVKLAEYIQKRELGTFLHGTCNYYGGWLNNGSHLVDTLRMLFDGELAIESVKPGAPGRINDPCLDVKLLINDAPVVIVSFDEKNYQIFESEFRFEKGRVLLRDFGADILVEKVEQNKLGERVLVPLPDSPWKGLDSPLYHGVDLISQYLGNSRSLAGRGILVDEASGTMDILWQALEKLEVKERK